MDEPSALDLAHTRMATDEADDAARLAFYERVADTEFLMLLSSQSDGDAVEPALFASEGLQFALLFDREERLAAFAQAIVPYVALSGRACVKMLARQNIGLGINLGVATSNTLLPPEVIEWLNDTLSEKISEDFGRPVSVNRPNTVSPLILSALNTKLALASGMAGHAYLVEATYSDSATRLLVCIVDAVEGSKDALASAVSEALIFSGLVNEAIDVAFFESSDAICRKLENVGLRFDIPAGARYADHPGPPGMDPSKPPKLR